MAFALMAPRAMASRVRSASQVERLLVNAAVGLSPAYNPVACLLVFSGR
jgi:hypothetical protein